MKSSWTVSGGALLYQEFLPAETLLYSVVLANPTRGRREGGKDGTDPASLLKRLEDYIRPLGVLQVGGDEAVGKGDFGVRLTTAGEANR